MHKEYHYTKDNIIGVIFNTGGKSRWKIIEINNNYIDLWSY